LVKNVAISYATVLLIEGPDPNENAKALAAVEGAIKAIEEQMDFLPKAIANPPSMVVIDHNSLEAERVLLWSMTLTPEDVNRPHAAVIYGRMRWLGPMFDGEHIDEQNLAEILFVVGNDCECGLDYRWLQGTMLPNRWAAKTREVVAENLGFDPENPMIQMEMARILGRGGAYYPSTPYGYQELEIEMSPADDEPSAVTDVNVADVNAVEAAVEPVAVEAIESIDANETAVEAVADADVNDVAVEPADIPKIDLPSTIIAPAPNQPDKRQLMTSHYEQPTTAEPNAVSTLENKTRLKFTTLVLLTFLIIGGIIFLTEKHIIIPAIWFCKL